MRQTDPSHHFPIQNLPIGIGEVDGVPRVVTRIGDYVLDLSNITQSGPIDCLNDVDLSAMRAIAYQTLTNESTHELIPINRVTMRLPYRIPQFVDFYAGIHHASNVGRMFRPDMPPLLPNYRHVPVGYNGRASSVQVSGQAVKRPNGQTLPKGATDPIFGPTQELDFELELGAFLRKPNHGLPIDPNEAMDHVAGFVLVNDWSARDIQRWEYQPLGPFLAKSFATSISPWVVLPEALEPFWVDGEPQDPLPLPHLRRTLPGHLDLQMEITLQTRRMTRPQVLSRSNARHLYWTMGQLLAHQASNGTPLEAGDLYASGTISGPDESSMGSLLELTWRGSKPIHLDETGEQRTFLEDGDTVSFSAFGRGDGYRIGFGDLTATVGA